MAKQVCYTLVAVVICMLARLNDAQRNSQKRVNAVCTYNPDEKSLTMYFAADYNGDTVDKVLAVNGRVFDRDANNEAACNTVQFGSDGVLITSTVYIDGTLTNINQCGGRRTIANNPNSYEWTFELREKFYKWVYTSIDRRYLITCKTTSPLGFVVTTVNVYGEDIEEPATRVKPENEMAILENRNGVYLRQPGGSSGIDIGETVKLQIRANLDNQYKGACFNCIYTYPNDLTAHLHRYGIKAFSCVRSTSSSFRTGDTFIRADGCAAAGNPFGLTRGFERNSFDIRPNGRYDIETEPFVFVPDDPDSHQYFLGCYVTYCYGDFDGINSLTDNCQYSCDTSSRKKRSTSLYDFDRVVLTVNINMNSTSHKSLDKEKGAQRVLIVVSTILGVAILGVIIVMVAFLLFAKRRRYRTDDSLSQSSTKSLPVQTNMKA